MQSYEPSRSDWKLFKEKIAGWQETYMAGLLKEYARLIDEGKSAADRFWELEQRIKEDKKKKSVQLELNKSLMVYDIVALINEGAIVMEDLRDFSDELRSKVGSVLENQRYFR